ncbi:MAG: hypothetical protein AB7S68_21660 [Polyangiaceae bacterium]
MKWLRAPELGIGLVGISLLLTVGCKKDEPDPNGTTTQPAVSTTAAAPASAADEAPTDITPPKADEGSVCQVEKEKSWGKWVNQRTGLTPTELPNSKWALGVAFGYIPAVLTVNPDGNATLKRITAQDGTKVGRKIDSKKERRDLQRVTPIVLDGNTQAYADYRDKLSDDMRRIACGPADSDKDLLVFDGKPVLDKLKDEQKDKPEPAKPAVAEAPEPSGAPSGSAGAALSPEAVKRLTLGRLKLAPGLLGKSKVEAPSESGEKLREVRDCRSFVDQRKQEVWGVASELVGEPKDGEYTWEMRFYVLTPGGAQVRIMTSKLGKDPKKLYTLEAPVAARMGDDYVLAARYQGALYAWHLNSAFKPKGAVKRYGGGYPSLVRFASDGDDTRLFTSQQVTKDAWRLASLRLTGGLPASLSKLEWGDESRAEPSFARSGSQRWMAYHQGDRRKAQVMVQAVDGDLNAQGKAFAATAEGDEVYESLLLPLSDGKLYLVMLKKPKDQSAPELVSQVLSCKSPS